MTDDLLDRFQERFELLGQLVDIIETGQVTASFITVGRNGRDLRFRSISGKKEDDIVLEKVDRQLLQQLAKTDLIDLHEGKGRSGKQAEGKVNHDGFVLSASWRKIKPFTSKELVGIFEGFEKDFMDNVYKQYHSGNEAKGKVALHIWEERFLKYLEDYLPGLIKKYPNSDVSAFSFSSTYTPLEKFMLWKGNDIVAFIQVYRDEAKSGRLDLFEAAREDSAEFDDQIESNEEYIAPDRIEQLRTINDPRFNFNKLISLCEEINSNWGRQNYYSVGMLNRAIIDHIPPVFGYKNFSEFVNNRRAEKSVKALMTNLDVFSRNVADRQLHSQIGKKEISIEEPDVDFRSAVNALIEEIVNEMK